MSTLVLVASEALEHKTWWNPYVKGGLIVLFAIGLFTGSVYLLLYTDVGSRLGFLLTASAFTGFMAVLSVFWISGQFPNGPLGKESGWPVREIVPEPSESEFEAVRDIENTAEKADASAAGQIRVGLDADLTEKESEFKLYNEPAEFLATQTFTKGGGRKWPTWWSEKTTYGAVEICTAAEPDVLPLAPPPEPECDDGEPTQWVVVVKDLGARRLPAFFFFAGSTLLFILSLLALNRYEKDVERPPTPGEGGGDGDGGGPSGDGSGEPEVADAEPEPAAT